jgi:hypothetical protein
MNKVSLTDLDLNEVNLLIAGLMELPAKASMPLYSKIKTQVDAQMSKENETGALPWNKE